MKKIMFNDKYGLTQAVLDGRKTMTRRIIPLTATDTEYLNDAFDWDFRESVIIDRYARYKVGEEVAIAQSYLNALKDCKERDDKTGYQLVFTHSDVDKESFYNKMFVRADLMPHQIQITDVRIERLQYISEEDCMKEGIYEHNAAPDALGMDKYRFISYAYDATIGAHHKRWWFETPKKAFAALIDKVSGKGTWKSNPYVFVYSFKLIK